VLAAGFVANPMGRRSAIAKILARPAAFRTRPPLWLLRKFLLGDGATGELAERLRAVIRSVSPDVLAQRARAVLSCDERSTLARTQMPLLYLRGKYDRVVGAECFEGIRKIRPDAQLEVVDSAHLLLQCQPRLTARHIVQFADETATNSQREQ
jgi:pimeloyl-ACP methyl ester carboxylesterase